MNRNPPFWIGALSRKTGVTPKTIRYYERLGLLATPPRQRSSSFSWEELSPGYRIYTEETVENLFFIRKAKELGLTLSEIKTIMGRSRKGVRTCCNTLKRILEEKIQEYDQKVHELKTMKKKLHRFLRNWSQKKGVEKLPYAICPRIEHR